MRIFGCILKADEELLILEGVDMFGLGNWAAVAEHVGTKGAQDCQQHYTSVYINSPAFPEPTPLASMANINQLQVHSYREFLVSFTAISLFRCSLIALQFQLSWSFWRLLTSISVGELSGSLLLIVPDVNSPGYLTAWDVSA